MRAKDAYDEVASIADRRLRDMSEMKQVGPNFKGKRILQVPSARYCLA